MFDDLKAQRLVQIQHKYYGLFFLGAAFVQPMIVCSLWGETLWNNIYVAGTLSVFLSFQSTMCVNSLAHMWGERFVGLCVCDVLMPAAPTTARSRLCRTLLLP